MIYLITHGKRNFGPNPGHTEEGLRQMASVIKEAADIPNIPLIVVGTGLRFIEIYTHLSQHLPNVPVQFSPFCGSADSMEANGQVILTNGLLVGYDNYVSVVKSPAFDAWKFVASFPDNTVLCAGGELMNALGIKSEKGQLYELDPKTRTAR
jgi:hypothetical protein